MTKDYKKYNDFCMCGSCKYFMLMDPWTCEGICGLCYRMGVYKDTWTEGRICKAFILKDSLRSFIGVCSEACSLYNSLGCPYLGLNNTGKACDEFRL